MARPLHVLLLSGLDETLSVERATLRQLGTRVRGLRSGRSALEYLAGPANDSNNEKPDLLVCTETLSDMGGRDFLRALARLAERTGQAQPPVLVVCGDRPDSFLELGAAATVCRPYTARTMSEALLAAQNALRQADPSLPDGGAAFGATPGLSGGRATDMFFVMRQRAAGEKLAVTAGTSGQPGQPGQSDQSDQSKLSKAIRSSASYREVSQTVNEPAPAYISPVKAATPAKPLPDESGQAAALKPLLHTRKGLRALRAGRLAEARGLFRAALQADSLDLEACLGLAGVQRRQGDASGEQRWLNRAVLICLETGQKARARSLQERLPREQADNPHLAEARYLLLEGNYAAAAEAFLKLSLRRGQPPLQQLVARAAQLTAYPEETLRELCEAFRQNGQPGLAATLYQRLLADTGPAERLDFEPQSFWTRFPRLYEVMAVARFTLQAWRISS